MAQLNNFSPLPWYEKKAGQDFRKWWKYGNIYPLYSRNDRLISSQIRRDDQKTGPRLGVAYTPATVYADAHLDGTGANIVAPPTPGSSVQVFRIGAGYIPDGSTICIRIPNQYEGGKAWSLLNSSYTILATGTDADVIDLSDYANPLFLFVEVLGDDTRSRVWSVTSTGVAVPIQMELYTKEGEMVSDLFADNPTYWSAKSVGYDDYLYTPDGATLTNAMPEGQYYLRISDGENEWYSDVFTVVALDDELVSIAWWDDEDFVMDAGEILYKGILYQNELLLRADIAKPSYDFEEEGETRDGVFYPTKQISKKKYSFHFLANEPLLDVMRFIRMADHVVIRYFLGGETMTLYPQTFLLTPEWESEGDVAGVSVEFETDTIAKKIGLAYIRTS